MSLPDRLERKIHTYASLGQGDALTLTFRLRYAVEQEGDVLCWTAEDDDCTEQETRLMMIQDAEGQWTVDLLMDSVGLSALKYTYSVYRGEELLRIEPPVGHRLSLVVPSSDSVHSILICDRWVEPSEWHRFSQPPLADSSALSPLLTLTPGHYIAFHAPSPFDREVRMVGSGEKLGAWNPSEGIPMTAFRHTYMCQSPIQDDVEYKFVLGAGDNAQQEWEEGENRRMALTPEYDVVLTYVDMPNFEGAAKPHWTTLEGTVIPLFALRTVNSYGIGDFGDALDFVTWLSSVGQSVYQMLPFYDTTFTGTDRDTYPYNAITTYGLHPIYMDVRRLPYYYIDLDRKARWETRALRLNTAPKVKYAEVLALKTEVMDACFEEWWTDDRHEDEDFCDYWEAEREQLLPYCLFCAIRDRGEQGLPSFESVMTEWTESHTILGSDARAEVMKHAFRQYYLSRQLMDLRRHADDCGVLLKGDLPIGVSRDSVDTWQNPDLFHLDMQAGAPPDAFSAEGQNWGFPTYDWERMAEDGYAWWRRRMQSMSRYLHALRIDHILGFFRIWTIPAASGQPIDGHYVPAVGYPQADIEGLEKYFVCDDNGSYHPMLRPEEQTSFGALRSDEKDRLLWLRDSYYYERNELLWSRTAMTRLSEVLSADGMLICAEDLGLLPRSVKEVLSSLELLSLEVLRMPKVGGHRFIRPEDIPALSVVTTSTHDTSSLRAWWQTLSEDERSEVSRLYGLDEKSPAALVQALRRIPCAMLILPLTDWCVLSGYGSDVSPADEQINYPGHRHHVWDYRMPGTISALPTSL